MMQSEKMEHKRYSRMLQNRLLEANDENENGLYSNGFENPDIHSVKRVLHFNSEKKEKKKSVFSLKNFQ